MKIDVVKVAKLANLQLSKILEYMEKLNEVDTQDTEPTFNVTGLSNVMREDETEACDIKKKGFYVTKGVFNE